MNTHIQRLQQTIEPYRQQIIHHKVYSVMNDLESLRVFMQYHVYAVWDFMSLLKSLQRNLTCTDLPWFPVGNADTRYLINEIVTGEEADIDPQGVRKSHFELYLDAMQQCGADTTEIIRFVSSLKHDGNLQQAYAQAGTPGEAKAFVDFTFHTIYQCSSAIQSAVFTFGREDLIPNMFLSIVNDLDTNLPGNVSVFKYYLERHIEVDGDHHSHLALEMTSHLCAHDEQVWRDAEQAVIESLQKRIGLWDGAYQHIMARKASMA